MHDKTKTGRYHLIDALRGLALLNMIAYHFLYDMNEVFGGNARWHTGTAAHLWQQYICWSFILISGFVWEVGRRGSRKRGFLLNAWGLLITAVTLVAVPTQAVWFGILNFLGCAVLLALPLRPLLVRIPPLFGTLASFLLFWSGRSLAQGTWQLLGIFTLKMPAFLYEIKGLVILGFPYKGFHSSDYFPILPWFVLFLVGYFLHALLEKRGWNQGVLCEEIPLLSRVGRYTMPVYLLHQPVCLAVGYLVCLFCEY